MQRLWPSSHRDHWSAFFSVNDHSVVVPVLVLLLLQLDDHLLVVVRLVAHVVVRQVAMMLKWKIKLVWQEFTARYRNFLFQLFPDKKNISSSLTSCCWLEGIKPPASTPISESLQNRKITQVLTFMISSSPHHKTIIILPYLDPVVGVKPDAKILECEIYHFDLLFTSLFDLQKN